MHEHRRSARNGLQGDPSSLHGAGIRAYLDEGAEVNLEAAGVFYDRKLGFEAEYALVLLPEVDEDGVPVAGDWRRWRRSLEAVWRRPPGPAMRALSSALRRVRTTSGCP